MAAHSFTDGEVASKAWLDSLIPGGITQAGVVRIAPVANTPTSIRVNFPTPFRGVPQIVVTAQTGVIGSTVQGVSVSDADESGFTLWVLRTNSTGTYVCWQAWRASTLFTAGGPAYASLLGQSSGALVAKVGRSTITPVANTPTSLNVNFGGSFLAAPIVVAVPVTTVPGTVVHGVAVTERTTTGFKLWIYRTSSSATDVSWIALGRI